MYSIAPMPTSTLSFPFHDTIVSSILLVELISDKLRNLGWGAIRMLAITKAECVHSGIDKVLNDVRVV